VFISLYFQTFWPKLLNFFRSCQRISVYDRQKAVSNNGGKNRTFSHSWFYDRAKVFIFALHIYTFHLMLQKVLIRVMNTSIVGTPCNIGFYWKDGIFKKLCLRAPKSHIWHWSMVAKQGQRFGVLCQNCSSVTSDSFATLIYINTRTHRDKNCSWTMAVKLSNLSLSQRVILAI